MSSNQVWNFAAGPAKLPRDVLKKVQAEFLNFEGTGCSLVEISHRSSEFQGVLKRAEAELRDLLDVPKDYRVLFTQGGASLQFSAVPLNLAESSAGKTARYVVTGVWSRKALAEAKRFCTAEEWLNADGLDTEEQSEQRKRGLYFGQVPPMSAYPPLDADSTSYVYYCANETVHGIEFSEPPPVPEGVPLVADMSSNFVSRAIDVRAHAAIVVGAQKNCGPAGLTLVIVHQRYVEDAPKQDDRLPTLLKWKTLADAGSAYNTPPTFAVYLTGLVFEWIKQEGGVTVLEQRNRDKATALYSAIDKCAHLQAVVPLGSRSRMNVVFRVIDEEGVPDAKAEASLCEQAGQRGLKSLKGHRSVGGLRASIYNAMPMEGVQDLIVFLKEFDLNYFK